MSEQLRQFGLSTYVLLGFLLLLVVVLALAVVAWVLIKVWIRDVRKRREAQRHHREMFRPDGKPYPPASRGICDRCGQDFEKVYYMPSGERLCPDDYAELHGP